MTLDEKLARIRAHRNNIHRYRKLLETTLSDLERQYIERRLAEETAARHLSWPGPFRSHFRRRKVLLILRQWELKHYRRIATQSFARASAARGK